MIDNSWLACTGNANGIEPLNCHRHRLAEKNNQFRAGRRLELRTPAQLRQEQSSSWADQPHCLDCHGAEQVVCMCSVLHFGLLLHCCCSAAPVAENVYVKQESAAVVYPQYCSAQASRHQCAFFRTRSVGSLRALFIISAIFEWLVNEQNALRYATSVDWCNS